jgi:phospholipid transport system substrate-binding protein
MLICATIPKLEINAIFARNALIGIQDCIARYQSSLWRRKMKIFNTAILLLIFSMNAMAGNDNVVTHPASLIVKDTTDKVLVLLEEKKSPKEVNNLINDIILPHFNFQQMSKWTLGKEWGRLDEGKQTLFVENFQQLLVNTYATALTEFDNQSIDILPAKSGKNKSIAVVPTVISLPNAKPMQISYMMMNGDEGWKVIDMSISGVSLIKNYRATYASQIRKDGFDALMEKLIKKNELAGL